MIYYRFLYRPLMKLAHRFDWHKTRTAGPFVDGSYVIRCDWCGLSQRTPPIDYALRADSPIWKATGCTDQSGSPALGSE